MFFLIDKKNKIAFGYSAKCGCSHIKKIYWYLMTNDENHPIHIKGEYDSMPNDYQDYTFIVIVRNPYKRIVSGFLDKYKPHGQFRHLWQNKSLSFENFVNTLIKGEFKEINKHHFTPQTTEKFNYEKLLKSKKLVVYDISKIDYSFIEKLYKKKIPKTLIDFRGQHANNKEVLLNKNIDNVFNLNIESYHMYKVPIEKFYNEDLFKKVKMFYINDIIFSKNNRIIYNEYV